MSVDIDVLDPSAAPGTGTPVPGGFTLEELEGLLRGVTQRRRVLGMDMVEVNALKDRSSMTSLNACRLLASLFD